MKRVLVLLVIVAAAAGLLWALRRRAPLPPPAPPRAVADAAAQLPPQAPVERPATPQDRVPEGTGGIRVTVVHRGRPLPDAEIAILPAGQPKPMISRTKSDGTQFVVGIPPGDYGLTARLSPYLPGTAHVDVQAGRIRELTLDLRRSARVHGRVVDAGGAPVPEARVLLLTPAGGSSSLRGTTDATGRYEITGLSPGAYSSAVNHPRYKRKKGADVALPAEGDEAELNFVVESGARIAGRVLDEEGRGIAGAMVTITRPGSTTAAKSDAEGRFEGGGLEEAPHNLSAMKDGYGIVYLRNAPVNGADVVLVMPAPGTVAGRLVSDPPAPAFQVVLHRFEESVRQELPVYSRNFTAPAEGRFVLKDVPPGTYKVKLIAGGYEMVGDPVPLVVEKNRTVEGLELRARPVN